MHMSKHITAATLLVLGGAAFNPASAELFTNPAAKSPVGKTQITGLLGDSTVTYDSDFNSSADVDRTFLGASAAYGMSDKLDIYGAFALITDAELEYISDDDSGTAFALGVRGILPVQATLKVHGYAQFLSIDEDYGRVGGNSFSGKETALSLGAVVVKKVDTITLYGGPELVLLSDGKMTVKGPGGDSFDGERDDILGLRAGAVIDAGNIELGLGIAIMHESGFTFSVSNSF